jgi:hypothetical protein
MNTNNALRPSLIITGVIVASTVLLIAGMSKGRSFWASPWGWHGDLIAMNEEN